MVNFSTVSSVINRSLSQMEMSFLLNNTEIKIFVDHMN